MVKTLLEATFLTGIASTANTNQYWGINGSLDPETTETNTLYTFRNAGVLSGLFCKISANSVAATSTFTMRKNATTNGNQTLSVGSNATGDFEDTTNTDVVVADDAWNLLTDPGAASGTFTITTISLIFDATTDTVQHLASHNGGRNYTTASTTLYSHLQGEFTNTATEANVKTRFRKAGTLRNLNVRVMANRATTSTVRLRKNGGNGNSVISITGGGATGLYSDYTNTDTVSAGEDWNYSVTTGTGSDTLTIRTLQCEFISTNGDGVLAISHSAGVAVTDNTNRFFQIHGQLVAGTTESATQTKARVAFELDELTCLVTQNGVSLASTCRTRVGAANGAQAASITGSTTGVFTDTTNTDTLTTTSQINYQVVVPSVAGTQTITVGNITCSTHITVAQNIERVIKPYTTFNGTSDFIDAGDDNAYDLSQFSVSTWFRTSADLASRGYLVNKGGEGSDTSGQNDNYSISMNNTETIRAGFEEDDGTDHYVTSPDSYNDGQWHNAIVTYDATNVRLYIDGSEVGTPDTTSATPQVNAHGIVIGRNSRSSANFFEGDISDVYVWNNDLTSSEISTFYTAGTVPQSGNIVYQNKLGQDNLIHVSDSIARLVGRTRSLSDTITISESSLTRLAAKTRTASDTTTIGESLTRLCNKFRTLATETVVIAEDLVRIKGKEKSLSDTVVISDSVTRLAVKIRTAVETTVIGESLTRLKGAIRSLATETVTVDAGTAVRQKGSSRNPSDTTSIAEQLDRLAQKTRTLSDTVTSSEQADRLKVAMRSLAAESIIVGDLVARMIGKTRTLIENTSIGESLTRLVGKTRALSDTVTTSENLDRIKGAMRSLATETVVIGDSVARMLGKTRTIVENTSTGESLNRLCNKFRNLATETVTISEASLTRMSAKIRALATEVVTITDDVARVVGGGANNVVRTLTETIVISDSITRLAAKIRILGTETITSGESVARQGEKIRTLSDTITIGSGTLNRLVERIRTLSDTTSIGESINRLCNKIRTASDSLSIGESAQKQKAANRSVATETVSIGDSVSRLAAKIRTNIETVISAEQLTRLSEHFRTLVETITSSENAARTKGSNRSLSDTITITAGTVARLCGKIRNPIETVLSSESLTRLAAKIRVITQTTVISDAVAIFTPQNVNIVRELIETVIVSDNLDRFVSLLGLRSGRGGAGGRKLKRLTRDKFKLKRYDFKLWD